MKIAIVGGGSMGTAFGRSLLESDLVDRNSLHILEKTEARRKSIEIHFAGGVTDNPICLRLVDLIIVAVKPQDLGTACKDIAPALTANKIVLSVMAGVSIETLKASLNGHRNIVRSMPNLPAQIGKGITVYCFSEEVEPTSKAQVEKVLGALGLCMEVKDEDLVEAATAVSGSGPGYVYFLIESFVEASKELGFSDAEAEILVRETLEGSLGLWKSSNMKPSDLRAMVTSKGGTTEAAVSVFEEGKMREVFRAGIKRARERARELRS